MFIGIIGTRYSGKSSVVTYLKSRSFTVLQLRSAANDEDDSTVASSDGGGARDIYQEAGTSKVHENAIPIPGVSLAPAGKSTSDSLIDLAGVTPRSDQELLEWGSRTPETHVNRDEIKDDLQSALRRIENRTPVVTSLKFSSPSEMLEYATRNWRSNFVTEDIQDKDALDPFLKRPFFLLVEVDAPIMLRLERAENITLEQLVQEHDMSMYGTGQPSQLNAYHMLRRLAHISVINEFPSLDGLWKHLDQMDLSSLDRLRPQWDTYFMTLTSLASQRSNCMKRRVGAILVRNNRILATGYNGTPRGLTNCNEGGCVRCNGKAKSGEALDECLCLHAEENALLEAGRERIGDGAVLYCNTCPCLRCSVKIVQTGVKEVVYNLAYSMDAATADVFVRAGVALRRYIVPPS